ncbi:MAG: hypothetical protein PHC70_00695 [Patescibacteria group bacterium]|nr:hypothetical protein [Patescibacteria group bacterium]
MQENRIRVRWRVEAGRSKGSVLEDGKGRRKIVFVDDHFRGRMPKDGEETEASISRDIKPEEASKGALIVRPIYAPPPGALSQDELRTKLDEIAKSQMPVFDTGYANVDLPGWKGEMSFKRADCVSVEPIYAQWSFHAEDGSSSYGRVEMTTAVRWDHGICCYRIVDLKQALKDLGEPAKVEGESLRRGTLTWRDSHGSTFRADACLSEALAGGGQLQDLRLENGYVVGDVALFNGKLVLEEESLNEGELFDSQRGVLKRASILRDFVLILKGEQRKQFVDLLRTTLHSPEWYQQRLIAEELNPEATWSGSAAVSLKLLQTAKDDLFIPRCEIDAALKRLTTSVERIKKYQAFQPAYESDVADPEIYIQGPDDAEEVDGMRSENQARLAQVQEAIESGKLMMNTLLELRQDESFPRSIRSELNKLSWEYAAAFQEAEKSGSAGAKFLLSRRYTVEMEIRQICDSLDYLARARNYEDTLECAIQNLWHLTHRTWPIILKEMREVEAQQAVPLTSE